jgi:hypothetical protein
VSLQRNAVLAERTQFASSKTEEIRLLIKQLESSVTKFNKSLVEERLRLSLPPAPLALYGSAPIELESALHSSTIYLMDSLSLAQKHLESMKPWATRGKYDSECAKSRHDYEEKLSSDRSGNIFMLFLGLFVLFLGALFWFLPSLYKPEDGFLELGLLALKWIGPAIAVGITVLFLFIHFGEIRPKEIEELQNARERAERAQSLKESHEAVAAAVENFRLELDQIVSAWQIAGTHAICAIQKRDGNELDLDLYYEDNGLHGDEKDDDDEDDT